ncbi:unnamed protein product [Caenorhabditis brenneri]
MTSHSSITPTSFIRNHWKFLFIGIIFAILLVTAILLILFLAILKPGKTESVTTMASFNLTSSTTVMTPTTIPISKAVSTKTVVHQSPHVVTASTSSTYPSSTDHDSSTSVSSDPTNSFTTNSTSKFDPTFPTGSSSTRLSTTAASTYRTFRPALNFTIPSPTTTTGHDGSTCKWDYGQGPLGAYSNFGSGSPNVTVGDCIYYAVSTKQWISHSCSDKNVNIVCELPTTKDDNCKNNYNNHCYLEINYGMTWDNAVQECQTHCGTLLTINSALENRFVQSIYSISGKMILGCLVASASFIRCVDHSIVPYNHLSNSVKGLNCVFMDYQTGNWNTGSCTKPAWFMCKRPVGQLC